MDQFVGQVADRESDQDRQLRPLTLVLISVHGLVRGHDLELGRDPDTGGQVKYVIELARALGQRPDVADVVLFTRRVVDPMVSEDYAQFEESLGPKSRIVRIECGEAKYLRKELLWDCLESFSDNVANYLSQHSIRPDIIHAHYADAGYVGTRLSHQLGIPLVFTGHSLGRNKRNQLLASGVGQDELEEVYRISRRIEAEEMTLGAAERIITSTQQEIEFQYGLYDFYQPQFMRVIPPGTDLVNFYPPGNSEEEQNAEIVLGLRRFLQQPAKPMILAVARPDPKKNFLSLIAAYGESSELQERANLILVAGNRDDIRDMDDVARGVLSEIMLAIDRYDLYGKVAYPKHHRPADIPVLLRAAACSGGVFVNPALTEPFGLTLIESAASGLPILATEDGGPSDIVRNLQNGRLVNPLDSEAITHELLGMLGDRDQWQRFADNGVTNVRKHYSWSSHVGKYLAVVRPLVAKSEHVQRDITIRRAGVYRDRALFTSLDLNLIGEPKSLSELLRIIRQEHKTMIFGIATGRRFDDALVTLRRNNIPLPDVLITGQGTEIHYHTNLTEDTAWQRHINHWWNEKALRDLLSTVPGLRPQPKRQQSSYQLSYFIDTAVVSPGDIRQLLQRNEQVVHVVHSFGHYLDIVPARASKGLALRWCAARLGFALAQTLVAGVTAADEDMLVGNTLGTVVDNRHREELAHLPSSENVFFTSQPYAAGILEAMHHYGFPDLKVGQHAPPATVVHRS